jgi:hypothetical protein
MQDTDSTELLSTAVSSARINEFADASRARNVVIVLDCCHAGAFRGADLGQAVAGPGRYVLTSCRGTQLANDATIENGTSIFTQHLVDGLIYAAADPDGDGYVTFSDLYTYVDRRLREAGKQIPQRRVDGDGDLPLAKRPLPASSEAEDAVPLPTGNMEATRVRQPQEQPGSISPPGSTPAEAGAMAGDRTTSPARPRPRRPRRKVVLAVAAVAVVAVGGVITGVVLLNGGSGGHNNPNPVAYDATGPWRLKVDAQAARSDSGCTITLTDADSGSHVSLPPNLYGTTQWQIHQAGSFRWQTNDPGCLVAAEAGPGSAQLPFAWPAGGDSDAFTAPARLAVQVTDYNGSQNCQITLRDANNGQPIDFQTAASQHDNNTVVLNAGGHPTAYLSDLQCAVRMSTAQ